MSFVQVLFFVVLGPRLWCRLAGPLLYLYFLVPFGAFLTPKLQDFTTAFVARGLPLLHIPAYITGYTIEIPEGTFLIAEACAGLRFLIAAMAFGCLYALLMYRSALRRALFVGVSVIVPIIANGLRALGIVALGHYLGSAGAVEADHVLYGWIFFSIVILILGILGLPFREDLYQAPTPLASRVQPANHVRQALSGAAGLIVLAAIGPAIAASIDRAAGLDVAVRLPSFVPAVGCKAEPAPLTIGLAAPGRMVVQRYDCGDGPVTLAAEVFSPRTTLRRLATEQLRLTGLLTGDDVEESWLTVQNSSAGAWRLMVATRSTRVAAAGIWIDGQPAQFGLMARARQAWRGVFGAHLRPVIIVVTAAPDGMTPAAPAGDGRHGSAERIVGFLKAQPALGEFVARLAATLD
jgi:exosortase